LTTFFSTILFQIPFQQRIIWHSSR